MKTSPSPSLMAQLRSELQRMPPFAQVAPEHLDTLLQQGEQRYFGPQEMVLSPEDGAVDALYLIRQGEVVEERGGPGTPTSALAYEPGELFPIGAATAKQALTTQYRSVADTFVLVFPIAAIEALSQRSTAFADHLHRPIPTYLMLSRQAQQVSQAFRALDEQSLETPLGIMAMREPVHCQPETPLREALTRMHIARVGSILITDPRGSARGILTRHDVLDKVLLAGVSLDTPISEVMVQPVRSLSVSHTAQDAALLMARHGLRHVPVTRDGVVVSMVSERDLFALHRRSLKQVSSVLRAAEDIAQLRLGAVEIHELARSLLTQGLHSRQLTALISHLNDVLTERVLQIEAVHHGIDLTGVSWLALGSEGREEQTIATDQDNALILPDDADEAQRKRVAAWARAVNLSLEACGYPLCKGEVMAGSPGGVATLGQWRVRFRDWIDHGAPQDLLRASICFDFRCLAGNAALAAELRDTVLTAARGTPRFLKQMALNALQRGTPLNWLGRVDTDAQGRLDLKLQGTALFVDAARILALAQGSAALGTRERLESAGRMLGVPQTEYQAWAGGFEFLQMLRLRAQLDATGAAPAQGSDPAEANQLTVSTLNDIDRRMLKESLRLARLLQQRLELDYAR